MAGSDRARLSGVYHLEPEAMLSHAIALALEVSCALAATESGKRSLMAVGRDGALCARAKDMMLRHMLRAIVEVSEPTEADFKRLVCSVAALAKES